MGYSQLPSNEADASYPPLYEETSSSASGWRNYIHLAKSGELVQRLYLDTDAAPTFGRFKNEEEQKEAKNAFLGGNFVNVTLHIRGSQKAHVVLKGSDQVYRKVIEIVSRLECMYGVVLRYADAMLLLLGSGKRPAAYAFRPLNGRRRQERHLRRA